MRAILCLLLALAAPLSSALADQGFVADGKEVAKDGLAIWNADGSQELIDIDSLPLIVLNIKTADASEVMIWQLHEGEVARFGIKRPGSEYDPTPQDGAIQIRDLGKPDAPQRQIVDPQLMTQLAQGKRFVMDTIELVIYAPWAESFKAEVVIPEWEAIELPNGTQRRSITNSKSQGWISGSLSQED